MQRLIAATLLTCGLALIAASITLVAQPAGIAAAQAAPTATGRGPVPAARPAGPAAQPNSAAGTAPSPPTAAPTRELATGALPPAAPPPTGAGAPTREIATGSVPAGGASAALGQVGQAARDLPPEVRLATLEKLGFIPEAASPVLPTDPQVVAFKAQLGALATLCRTDQNTLADLAVATHRVEATRHVAQSLASILTSVSSAATAGSAGGDCRAAFAAQASR